MVSKYVFETKVTNCFKFSDIFNDTSLHSFPFNKLPLPSDPLWQVRIILNFPRNLISKMDPSQNHYKSCFEVLLNTEFIADR